MVGKILIVDDVATNRIVLKARLAEACYAPLLAKDGESCLAAALQNRPDLVVLDLALPDQPGTAVIEALRSNPRTADIPVIALCGPRHAAQRLPALQAGADDVLAKPVSEPLLMARIRNLLRSRAMLTDLTERGAALRDLGLAEPAAAFDMPGTAALVTERRDTALRWRKLLDRRLADHVLVLSRAEALADPGATADAFVIDSDLGGAGGGLRLLSELRSRSASRHATTLLMMPDTDLPEAAMAYDMGANDICTESGGGAELALRLQRLLVQKRMADRLRASLRDGLRLAAIDPLTGLYNRRYALPRLAAIAERALLRNGAFAVMVIDIDRFKSVNDRWGHAAGDSVLVAVAQRLSDNLRGSDLIARIGGEEFLVALPDTAMPEARATAERIRAVVQNRPIPLPGGETLHVTVSIGLAGGTGAEVLQQGSLADLVNKADHALLAAKAGGRNQVMLGRSAA